MRKNIGNLKVFRQLVTTKIDSRKPVLNWQDKEIICYTQQNLQSAQ